VRWPVAPESSPNIPARTIVSSPRRIRTVGRNTLLVVGRDTVTASGPRRAQPYRVSVALPGPVRYSVSTRPATCRLLWQAGMLPSVIARFHQRRSPAKGVHISARGSNWVFLTVCTGDRARWLARADVQRSLHDIWARTATTWLVCDFLLMPDPVHLFCAPGVPEITIECWMTFWKGRLTRTLPGIGKFQRGGFHHRLRTGESYFQKWQYVRENPVRAGLVERPEDWPYQGRVHEII